MGWTSPLVVAEIVFILSNSRTYAVPRSEIRDRLLPLLRLPGIGLERKRLFDRVFELYTTLEIDYIDCYHAALIEHAGQESLYSFDGAFDMVLGLSRSEP